jgi:hypothetical protein
MEIKINKENGITSRGGKIPQGSTYISPNLIRQSKMIDQYGNTIDPVTKQVIKFKDDKDEK